jgi:hypothetical protein
MANRQVNNHDIINYLQDNQALLKTILWRLEQSSTNPEQVQKDDLNQYHNYLNEIKNVFDKLTALSN